MMKQLIGKEIDGEHWVLGQYISADSSSLYFAVTLEQITADKTIYTDRAAMQFEDFFEIEERRIEFIRTFFLFYYTVDERCLENPELSERTHAFWKNYEGTPTYKAILSLNWTEDELTSVLDFCNNNVESITGLSIQQVSNLLIDQFQLEEQK